MTNQATPNEVRERLRNLLVESTNCGLQEAADGSGWPCGTCLMHLLDELGLDSTSPAYQERDTEPDRHNEVWRAILQIRDAPLAA